MELESRSSVFQAMSSAKISPWREGAAGQWDIADPGRPGDQGVVGMAVSGLGEQELLILADHFLGLGPQAAILPFCNQRAWVQNTEM